MNLNFNDPSIYEAYVDYQDTDAGGVVFHSKYIDFAERARGSFFRKLFVSGSLRNSYMWVVKDITINYMKPARLEDLIIINSKVAEIKNCSIIFKQDFFIKGKLIVSMLITLVSINKDFSFLKIEDEIKNQLSKYKIGEDN